MSQKPIHTFAKWKVKEGELDAVLKEFAEGAEKSSTEDGNLFYKVHQSNLDANLQILFEGYINASAVEAHRNSQHYQDIVIGNIIPKLESREVFLTTELDFEEKHKI